MRTVLVLILMALCLPPLARAGEYRLTVEEAEVMIDGRPISKMTINGGVPGPVLRLTEGEDATITVTNRTRQPTSVHWHGLLLPGIMDGAPGFNGFRGIPPGESYTYTFPIRQHGTYWYHSHSGSQDQTVLGALIIAPRAAPRVKADRDYVVLLSDITAEDAGQVLRNLKADPGYYNVNKRTVGDFFADAERQGMGGAVRDRLDWGSMRMDPTDLADVTGYAFLANGRRPDENETLLFRPGERVRMRLINGSAMTFFDIRIPGLEMTVIAADGNDVEPVTVDELRMGVAERYDIIVSPSTERPYTLVAESIDRMGHARVTLASAPGQIGPDPERRPRVLLTMADMGAAHAGMVHGDAATDHAAMGHAAMGHAAMGHAAMDHRGGSTASGWASGFPAEARVLGYQDLKSVVAHEDNRPPDRSIEVRLTGNMERYVWTLNDARFGETPPIRVRDGERVRLTFVNETMMAHPMHLHGMFFEVEAPAVEGHPSDARRPLKDTLIVPPGQSASVILTVRELGAWPLHCHLLYHMLSGMMTALVVEPAGSETATPDRTVLPMGVGNGTGHHH